MTARRRRPAERYFDLVRLCPLVPIANDKHLDEATAFLHTFTPGEVAGTLTADERAYMYALSTLIEAYEDEHESDDFADLGPADLVRGLLDARGWTQSEFARETGISPSTVNAVLRGKRGFTAGQAADLSARFRLAAGAFLPAPTPAAGR